MAKANQEGLELTGLGYVVFHWSDSKEKQQTVRWRRPTLREYRELRNLLQELGRGTQGMRDELDEHLRPLNEYELAVAQRKLDGNEGPVPARPEDPDWEKVDDLRSQIADYLLPWTVYANKILAVDGSLPEDLDDWPAWGASSTLPSEIISHYRQVPKAPGAKGTNTPQPSEQS